LLPPLLPLLLLMLLLPLLLLLASPLLRGERERIRSQGEGVARRWNIALA
jgi:competence protein ComGC